MKAKSIEEIVEAVAEPEVTGFINPEYIALRDITIHAQNATIQRYQPFPNGLSGVDYENLLANKFIATFAEFQSMDKSGRCLSCGL